MLTFSFGCVLEIADAAGLVFYLVDADFESDILQCVKTRCPERIVDVDIGKEYRLDCLMRLFRIGAGDGGHKKKCKSDGLDDQG